MIEHYISSPDKATEDPATQQQRQQPSNDRHDPDRHSVFESMKARVSKIFHLDSDDNRRGSGDTRSRTRKSREGDNTGDSDSSSSISLPPRTRTPMLDPSTNIDLATGSKELENSGANGKQTTGGTKKKKPEDDVSKHTFYIVNSQMRLKLSAPSEVRAHYWIHLLSIIDLARTASNATVDYCPRKKCIFQPLHWSK